MTKLSFKFFIFVQLQFLSFQPKAALPPCLPFETELTGSGRAAVLTIGPLATPDS